MCDDIELVLTTDQYPDETTWSVTGPCGGASGGPYSQQLTDDCSWYEEVKVCEGLTYTISRRSETARRTGSAAVMAKDVRPRAQRLRGSTARMATFPDRRDLRIHDDNIITPPTDG